MALLIALHNDNVHCCPERPTHGNVRAKDGHEHIPAAKEQVSARRVIDHGFIGADMIGLFEHGIGLQDIAKDHDIGGKYGGNSAKEHMRRGKADAKDGVMAPQ